jgi:tetratricopeptide (TPR) repeat protein
MDEITNDVEVKEAQSGRFNTLMAVMIAIVTVLGALVAWRSSVAATEAGNEDDAGIIAALNAQESSTIGNNISNNNRTNFLSYWTNKQLILEMVKDGTLENIPGDKRDAISRSVTEASDLATANKGFFAARYLNPDDTYNIGRENGETLAAAAEKKDLNSQAHFDAANVWRDKSLLLVGALFILAISLWLFAAAETIDYRVEYVLAAGGFAFLLLGIGTSLAVENGVAIADLAFVTYVTAAVLIGLVALGCVIVTLALRSKSTDVESSDHDPGESRGETRFKQAATFAIATLALLGAGAAYLQTDAGFRGDASIRRAQLLAAESLGVQSTGEANVNYQWGGAAKTYEELSVLANSASEAGDTAAQKRYLAIQSGVTGMSDLLKAPYFNPEVDSGPNISAYQADGYVARAATLSEASTLAGDLENAWEAKSNAYVIHLTLLATALALLGLALTLAGRTRPLFVGVGSLISVVAIVWMGLTLAQPIKEVPQTAIDAYGRGIGAAYHEDYKGAVAAFDESLTLAPGYASALYERAGAYSSQGELEKAVADYRAAQSAGRDDATVAQELGQTYYLLGDFDAALASFKTAMERDPKRVTVQLDIATTLLAAGKLPEARAAYQSSRDGISAAVAESRSQGKEPPPSLWYYLDTGADDLEGLFYQVSGEPREWTSAPPREKIAASDEVLAEVEKQFVALKDLTVALEYTGKPPAGTLTAQISDFRFGTLAEDGSYAVSATYPSETKDIYTLYHYDGMQDGRQVVWKVFIDGVEYPEYRTVMTWEGGVSGDTARALTDDFAFSASYSFAPGEYTVEMYVDGHMAQRDSFKVEAPKAIQ